MTRSRYSIIQKLDALRMTLSEQYTWQEAGETHKISVNTLKTWKVDIK